MERLPDADRRVECALRNLRRNRLEQVANNTRLVLTNHTNFTLYLQGVFQSFPELLKLFFIQEVAIVFFQEMRLTKMRGVG